jgi:hypothetical protein
VETTTRRGREGGEEEERVEEQCETKGSLM